MRILFVILRKTYGFSKHEDWISLSQFVEATDIPRPHVCRTLKGLIMQNIVTRRGNGKQVMYKLQKDWEKWTSLPDGVIRKGGTRTGNKGVPARVIQGVPARAHTKETITKENIQKKERTPSQVATMFFDDSKSQEDTIEYLKQKGLPEDVAKEEVYNFVMYWTEPNKSGTRVRWQMEKTFDVKRRLFTWFRRIKKFSKAETKGIVL